MHRRAPVRAFLERAASLVALVAATALLGCSSSGTDPGVGPEDTGVVTDGASDTPSTTTVDLSLVVLPDDGAAKIYDPIRNATKSVHCEMYMLTDDQAVAALIAAKKAGREVQVLLEKDPFGATTANDAALKSLQAAGVDVRWAPDKFALTHSKFFVVDGAVAYVMTLNLTNAGVSGNREYAAVVRDPDDVAQAEAVFAADLAGTVPPAGGKLVLSPTDARPKILALIDAATKSIDIEMEEFSDSAVFDHLVARVEKGVVVRVVAPRDGRSTGTTTMLGQLRSFGMQVKTLATPDMHAKLVVVDGKALYVGSVNLTAASMDKNRELGVVTETAAVVTRAAATFETDFGKAAPL